MWTINPSNGTYDGENHLYGRWFTLDASQLLPLFSLDSTYDQVKMFLARQARLRNKRTQHRQCVYRPCSSTSAGRRCRWKRRRWPDDRWGGRQRPAPVGRAVRSVRATARLWPNSERPSTVLPSVPAGRRGRPPPPTATGRSRTAARNGLPPSPRRPKRPDTTRRSGCGSKPKKQAQHRSITCWAIPYYSLNRTKPSTLVCKVSATILQTRLVFEIRCDLKQGCVPK